MKIMETQFDEELATIRMDYNNKRKNARSVYNNVAHAGIFKRNGRNPGQNRRGRGRIYHNQGIHGRK